MADGGFLCTGCRVVPAGANAFRNAPEVQAAVLARAQRIASACGRASGEAYYADVQAGPQRCRAVVHPGSSAACRDNARNNTVLRSIDAGRG
ncbi:hypothetical protein [Adlercreutzia mucosicola]|uniref:hypothetical protein n=1 Tax=Adlercreutzia mucosicola TaxID=580026 RepID=UPI000426496E|nr:hypothetical protein [Adlercreutzia mucosicola]MCR2036241.1 hypothetical protein [Adlercreutzia mucosicola]